MEVSPWPAWPGVSLVSAISVAHFQGVTAQSFRILAGTDREHLPRHVGCHPVGHQGREMRLRPIQLRFRPAMRWPTMVGFIPAAPGIAKSRKPHRDLAEKASQPNGRGNPSHANAATVSGRLIVITLLQGSSPSSPVFTNLTIQARRPLQVREQAPKYPSRARTPKLARVRWRAAPNCPTKIQLNKIIVTAGELSA
jgi:hypothetical protein